MNGYNFTERVRRVLARARDEAFGLAHEYVGTEHILLGLIAEDEGVASAVLRNLGADREEVRRKVHATVQRGTRSRPTGPDLPYTSRAKKVLELSMSEARLLHHSYVGTEHLLLGLLAEQKGIAAQILTECGVTLERARGETLSVLGSEKPPVARDPLTGVPHVAKPGYARTRTTYAVALVEDFTGRARDALRAAYDEASARGESSVSIAHVLLGLALRTDGMASVILDQITGGREQFAEALAHGMPELRDGVDRSTLQLADDAQRALDSSLLEASKDGHRRAGTQHLLLAILDALPPTLADVCARHGVTAKAVRAEYDRMRE